MRTEYKSPFVVVEGGSGSGKTTAIKSLREELIGWDFFREPGGTEFGDLMRDAVQERKDLIVDPVAAMFAYSASRANLVYTEIMPRLRGEVACSGVLLDRFWYSTYAYQGSEQVGREMIMEVSRLATGGLEPNLVLHYDLLPKLAMTRKRGCTDVDRYDLKELAFHRMVRERYLELAYKHREFWRVIDGSQSKEKVLTDSLVALKERGLV